MGSLGGPEAGYRAVGTAGCYLGAAADTVTDRTAVVCSTPERVFACCRCRCFPRQGHCPGEDVSRLQPTDTQAQQQRATAAENALQQQLHQMCRQQQQQACAATCSVSVQHQELSCSFPGLQSFLVSTASPQQQQQCLGRLLFRLQPPAYCRVLSPTCTFERYDKAFQMQAKQTHP